MTTFSQLVDRVLKETVRPDLIDMLPGYLNQTIRELFVHAQTGLPCFYDDARHEEQIELLTLTNKTFAYVWELPRPTRFQAIESVYYDSIQRYVYKGDPRTALARNDFNVDAKYYWYRVANAIVMSAPGKIGDTVRVSWFEYPRALAYQQEADRVFVYDQDNDMYAYKSGIPDPEAAKEAATNWALERFEELLAEGLRAKAYKRMNDERQRTFYSNYETMRLGVQNTLALNFETRLAR